jgi:hypothetical protein
MAYNEYIRLDCDLSRDTSRNGFNLALQRANIGIPFSDIHLQCLYKSPTFRKTNLNCLALPI